MWGIGAEIIPKLLFYVGVFAGEKTWGRNTKQITFTLPMQLSFYMGEVAIV